MSTQTQEPTPEQIKLSDDDKQLLNTLVQQNKAIIMGDISTLQQKCANSLDALINDCVGFRALSNQRAEKIKILESENKTIKEEIIILKNSINSSKK